MLRTHMRMNGSWHIYRPGEAWQRPRRDMRVVVATKAFEAVGFNVPVAEFLKPRGAGAAGRPAADGAGPARRARSTPTRPCAASGNAPRAGDRRRAPQSAPRRRRRQHLQVRSAVPVRRRIRSRRVDGVSDETLRAILATARKHLKANVIDPKGGDHDLPRLPRGRRGARMPSERRYVYGRARKPCRKCGTPIAVQAQGPHARLTYWCPACQA